MSRAVVIHAFGAPSTFRLEEREVPSPGPGKLTIKTHAAGVSFVDVLVSAGEYQLKPPLPFIPGSEFAGIVTAVGDGVDPARIGQRVLASAFGGAFAEESIVPAKLALPIPADMSFAEASVFRVSFATAYYALIQRGRLKAGETVLVLGAGGAVGYAAIEVAKALGATVIGSASSNAKRALAIAAGADAIVDSRSNTWRDDVKAANGGRAIDVVIDPIGGEATERAFRSLAWNGRLLVIGFAGGSIARLPVNLALLKGAALVGVDLRQFGDNEPEAAAANVAVLFELYEAGRLHPPIAKTYALDDFAAAMVDASTGETAGRIVLTMR
ncbi:MAG: NADPH:quinone oxidoreductase family protein [Candidatus Sphingomonas colombiensis]|nr:NADPH:quinone oxidoreductase family protein [Sphingomonas sp.]WEK42393.1 MAG: NADPH:quinone oxidoreductase family protein [Sphingomonas sp.]